MRVQEISGKDVHNMKARSLPHKMGVQGVQGCPGVQEASSGGAWGFSAKKRQKHEKPTKKLG